MTDDFLLKSNFQVSKVCNYFSNIFMVDSLVINLPVASLANNASQNLAKLSKGSGITIDVSSSKQNMSVFLKTAKQLSYEQLNEVDLDLFKYKVYDKACKHVVKTIELDKDEVSRIIGKRGIRIKQLQQMFSIRLNINKSNEMTLTGHEQSIDDCLKEINYTPNSKFTLSDEEMVLFLLLLKKSSSNIPSNIKSIQLGASLDSLVPLFKTANRSNKGHSVSFNGIVPDLVTTLSQLKTSLNFSSLSIPLLKLPTSEFRSIQSNVLLNHFAYLYPDGTVFAQKDDLLSAMHHLLTIKQGFSTVVSVSNAHQFQPYINSQLFSNLDIQVHYNDSDILLYSTKANKVQLSVKCVGMIYPAPFSRSLNDSSSTNTLILNSKLNNGVHVACHSINNELYLLGCSVDGTKVGPVLESLADKIVSDSNKLPESNKQVTVDINPEFTAAFKSQIPTIIKNHSTSKHTCTIGVNGSTVTILGPSIITTPVAKHVHELLKSFKSDNYKATIKVKCNNLTNYKIEGIKDIYSRNNLVTVIGIESQVNAVISQLNDLLVQQSIQVSKSLIVENPSVIIGKNGVVINKLQQVYGVSIKAEYSDSSVTITGDPTMVDKCIKDVQRLLSTNESNNQSTTLECPVAINSWIIGKNGARINKLRQLTLTTIDINEGNIVVKGLNHELCSNAIKFMMDYYKQDKLKLVVNINPAIINRADMNIIRDELLSKPLGRKMDISMVIASIVMDKPWTDLERAQYSVKNSSIHIYGWDMDLMTEFKNLVVEKYKNVHSSVVAINGINQSVLMDIEDTCNVKIHHDHDKKNDNVEVIDQNGLKRLKIVGEEPNIAHAITKIKELRNAVSQFGMSESASSMVLKELRQYDVFATYKNGELKVEGVKEQLNIVKGIIDELVKTMVKSTDVECY
eukprot:NODE_35_length_31537_cov_0.293403.p1 type:complete len:907 gc:universal NODE_35_length_31537_cov_0.293403:2444-5164(+)